MSGGVAPFARQYLLAGLEPDGYRARYAGVCEGQDEFVERDIHRALAYPVGVEVRPCPAWCTDTYARHTEGFEFNDDPNEPGEWMRVHSRDFRPGISVYQDEVWRDGSLSFAAPRICVTSDIAGDIDGPGVRQLAAALLNAADEWDRIASGSA